MCISAGKLVLSLACSITAVNSRGITSNPIEKQAQSLSFPSTKDAGQCRDWTDKRIGGDGRYHGEVKDFFIHGDGIFVCDDGSSYDGSWYERRKHGDFIFTDLHGKQYKQLWDYGRKLVEEPLADAKKSEKEVVPTGTERQAQSQHQYSPVSVFKDLGECRDWTDIRMEKGRYHGEVKDFSMHGDGIFIYDNGPSYDGSWYEQLKHGEFIFTDLHGKQYKQLWDHGRKLVEEPLADAKKNEKEVVPTAKSERTTEDSDDIIVYAVTGSREVVETLPPTGELSTPSVVTTETPKDTISIVTTQKPHSTQGIAKSEKNIEDSNDMIVNAVTYSLSVSVCGLAVVAWQHQARQSQLQTLVSLNKTIQDDFRCSIGNNILPLKSTFSLSVNRCKPQLYTGVLIADWFRRSYTDPNTNQVLRRTNSGTNFELERKNLYPEYSKLISDLVKVDKHIFDTMEDDDKENIVELLEMLCDECQKNPNDQDRELLCQLENWGYSVTQVNIT